MRELLLGIDPDHYGLYDDRYPLCRNTRYVVHALVAARAGSKARPTSLARVCKGE
jgi:hypothetical protein